MIENNKNISFWSRDELTSTDIVIVGAGIVGVSTAISIVEQMPDRKVHIVDKGTGKLGASVRNAGFACFGSVSEIIDDIEQYGEKSALDTIKMRWQGLSLLRERVGDETMDYKAVGGYELFDDIELKEKCFTIIDQLNEMIAPLVGFDECYINEKTNLGQTIKNQLEGVLHPVKMLSKLKHLAMIKGVVFHYGIEVTNVDSNNQCLETNVSKIYYNDCVVTINAWTSKLLPDYVVNPARNHVLVTNQLDSCPVEGAFHMDRGYVYFRNIENRLLIGGARNIDLFNEETYDQDHFNEKIVMRLKSIINEQILKGISYKIDYQWTGLLGVSGDKMPVIEKISNGLYLAVKMGGMGVAIGSYVGKAISKVVFENSKN